MINWIIGTGAAAVVIASIIGFIRNSRNGKSSCGCSGCSGCADSEQCGH